MCEFCDRIKKLQDIIGNQAEKIYDLEHALADSQMREAVMEQALNKQPGTQDTGLAVHHPDFPNGISLEMETPSVEEQNIEASSSPGYSWGNAGRINMSDIMGGPQKPPDMPQEMWDDILERIKKMGIDPSRVTVITE